MMCEDCHTPPPLGEQTCPVLVGKRLDKIYIQVAGKAIPIHASRLKDVICNLILLLPEESQNAK